MTESNIRKTALDAVLKRIHLEGYEDNQGFAKEVATWFSNQTALSKEDFIDRFDTGHSFFKYNQINDKNEFLSKVYGDVASSIEDIGLSTQLYPGEIDSFEKIVEVESKDVSIDPPIDIPESDVKDAFREIIGEPLDQIDWGGERNDLFTSQVILNGRRIDTAFMLKGPSVGPEMYVSDAGKRGDQVQRLFDSPAALYIIQFNGKFDDRMVQHIKEQAKISGAQYFCIIDGTDTYRLLSAYDVLRG